MIVKYDRVVKLPEVVHIEVTCPVCGKHSSAMMNMANVNATLASCMQCRQCNTLLMLTTVDIDHVPTYH